eukprot:2648306-Pyramimonas_sp.AAC.2
MSHPTQSRLSNGTMMLSNYVTRECDELSEVSAGHYVYGARRCAFPLKVRGFRLHVRRYKCRTHTCGC